MKYRHTPHYLTLKLHFNIAATTPPETTIRYHGDAKRLAKIKKWWVLEVVVKLENDKEIKEDTLVFTSKTKTLFSEMRKDIGADINKHIDSINADNDDPYEPISADITASIVDPI